MDFRKQTAMGAGLSALTIAVVTAIMTFPAASDRAVTQQATPIHAAIDTFAECEGQVWPYQTSDCIAAITASNGEKRSVRIISKADSVLPTVYAELSPTLHPTGL
ncbi:MAG: hypothetical protein AAF619_03140 [Pseudomonadota bacterium]